jgi:6-phosphogluconolactonase (cycloisomerase 2 family)
MSTVSRCAVAVLAAGVLACIAEPAAAQTAPSFAQLTGEQGCLIPEGLPEDFDFDLPRGCGVTPGLGNPTSLLVAPDGGQVYIVGDGNADFGTNGVSVFARDRATGALTLASCITDNGGHGPVGSAGICADGDALAGASALALSDDGRAAYVTAADQSSVSWFSRDTDTGKLTQRGCLKQLVRPGERCGTAPALAGAADVAASPDGKHVYVAAERSSAVAVMKVDPDDGALTEQSCVSDSGSNGVCARVPALAAADGLALSPDGEDLYVTSSRTGALVILAVDRSGDLIAKGCLLAHAPQGPCTAAPLLDGAQDAVLTHDGRSLLVVASGKRALISYARDAGTGLLTQQQCLEHVGAQGADAFFPEDTGPPDLDPGCQGAKALGEVSAVAVSGDGRAVFTVAQFDDFLAAFQRDPASGRLTQFACAEDDLSYKSCTESRGAEGANALAASPDARNLYLTASSDVLAVFAASVAITSARVTARPDGTIRVALACPRARREGCRGMLAARGVRRGRSFRLAAGRATGAMVRLPARATRQLHGRGSARVTLIASDSRRPFGATSRLVTVVRG